MANQTTQRQNVATQAAAACQALVNAIHTLNNLTERKAFLGAFLDADFTGTDMAYCDAATINLLFDRVAPAMNAAYNHAAYNDADGFQLVVASNTGRNKQILNQVAKTL